MDDIPLFRTVSIDHSFYRPASATQLAYYARQVSDDFRFCSNVWEEITIPACANLLRYGAKAGKPNPRCLDIGAFRDLVWAPAQESLGSNLGPFIVQFQRWGLEPAAILEALDRFLGILPPGPQYATEVRISAILGSRFLNILRTDRVSHVYNHLQHNLEDDPMSKPCRPTVPLQLAALMAPALASKRRQAVILSITVSTSRIPTATTRRMQHA